MEFFKSLIRKQDLSTIPLPHRREERADPRTREPFYIDHNNPRISSASTLTSDSDTSVPVLIVDNIADDETAIDEVPEVKPDEDQGTDNIPQLLLHGVVVTVKDEFGFIQPDEKLPETFLRPQVQFVFDNVKHNQKPVANNKVIFCLNNKSAPDKPSAKWVLVLDNDTKQNSNAEKNSRKDDSAKQKRFSELYIGKVKTIKKREDDSKPDYGFIKPLESLPQAYTDKDIFFSLKNVQSGGLELEVGDKLEFSLGVKDKENPVGFKLKLVECKARSGVCVERYIRQSLHKLMKTDEAHVSSEWLLGLMTCPAVWICIGSAEFSDKSIENLMMLVKYLEKESKGLYENFKQTIEAVASTPVFNPWKGRYQSYVKEKAKEKDMLTLSNIKEFLLMIMKYVPKKTRAVVALIKPLLVENSTRESFLYDVLKQASKSTDACIEDMEWDELPLVPSITEMLHGVLESNISIQPVKPKGPYDSVQQYIDTYFRLLRADCFEALTKGIKSLLKGKLDPRDMHVYHDIELAGILITQTESGLSLGLKVSSQSKIKNWDHASNLMFGNLVCISPSGNFRDAIWATVVDRSLLQTKRIVLLDLCTESNDVSDPEAVRMLELSSGRGLMAESPAYYRAYQPVLKALQKLNPEELPFQDELVKTKRSELPSFIQPESTVDGTVIYKNFSSRTDFQALCMDESAEGDTTLDHSQQAAVKQALRNRVAIVQGPPGTGKTFIGIRLIQLLASFEPKPKLPMLVLTYKNHALDEFLKDIIPHFEGKVARVGGRSQDPDLEGCNLNELKRVKHYRMSDSMFHEVKNCRDTIDAMKPNVIKSLNELCNSKSLSMKSLRSSLSRKQIQCILQGCDWSEINISSLKQTDEEGFKIASGKKDQAKILKMQKEEADDILEKLQCDAEDFLSKNYDPKDPLWKHVNGMVKEALKQWLPDKKTFNNVMDNNFGRIKLSAVDIIKEVITDDIDEKDAAELEKERLAASNPKFKSKDEILKEMIMLTTDNKSTEWVSELAPNTKNLIKDLPVGYLVNIENLWELNMKDRVLFVQGVLFSLFEQKGKEFENILKEYQRICTAKNEIENQHKVDILKQMSVVGMTITGASINQQLLSQLRPAIVVVEEAAEVLEPQLLATIGSWCQQLVLIGDHKQLRPPVESFTLRRDFHLDVSMMERLINNDLEYSTLLLQNRMLPEFAELLKDIYPKLESNYDRVTKNQPPPCVDSPLFFWDHTDPEISARSYSNEEEANRAIRLSLFLIQQCYQPKEITILGAYLGQVRLLKQKLKQAEIEHKSIFELYDKLPADEANEDEPKKLNRVKIQTIDNYQGDENEVVIVSLVRSNNNNKVGFLNTLNRRCVAQSRAKCGMYFIGNRNTVVGSQHWGKIIGEMSLKGHVGAFLKLQCPRHPYTKFLAQSAADITLGSFCQMICCKMMRCDVHHCKRKCQPSHSHLFCYEKVSFVFPTCKHAGERLCMDKEEKQLCKQKVPVVFEPCKHTGTKSCYKSLSEVKCKEKCALILPCQHPCGRLCSEPCDKEATCNECDRLRKAEEERIRKAKEAEIRRKKEEIKLEIDEMKKLLIDDQVYLTELKPDGTTASNYFDVEDMVKKYIQVGHHWYPKVTKIVKVKNDQLKLRWLEARKKRVNPLYAPMKFHGTTTEAVKAIIEKGFLLPKPNKQMYGPGIYFATDSSKSAQELYTKGSKTLLLCSVQLGKSLTVDSARPEITYHKLKVKGYDSLYAKRDTRETGGVKYDEYVVYDKDQALPEYIIHYEKLKLTDTVAMDMYAMKQQKLTTYNIRPSREIKQNDVLDTHFRIAESQFLRLLNGKAYNGNTAKIKSVDFVVNPPLLQKFHKMSEEFGKKYNGTVEADYILAFHGTKKDNIDNIVKTNFDINRLASNTGDRGLYGAGIYFSEFPSVSIGYGSSLLLSKVLPGKSYDVPGNMVGAPLQPGYDSHRARKDTEGRGHELVIYNPDQILPCYIINLQ